MAKAIHQIVAGYTNGDGVSNEARIIRDLFRSWGFTSEIYSETRRILPELRHEARDASQLRADLGPDDRVMLHFSIGTELNLLFRDLPCKKILRYHNITPSAFFKAFNPDVASQLDRGREQLDLLAGCADLNLAVSGYNARELEDAGYTDVKVFSLILDLDRIQAKPSRKVLVEMDDAKAKVLFVGRMAPNKRIEDLLHAFYYFQKFVHPESRLVHVGSWAGMEMYYAMMEAQKKKLQLEDAGFYGAVPEAHLSAYYQAADVFLCMSEHEGFCIPLLEAMVAGIPVLAFDSSAVAETMDGSGIVFTEKHFDEIAEMLGRLVNDVPFRRSVIEGQFSRIERYRKRDFAKELREMIDPV
jgi:glycosyltransferase involved in cell wall biosynthesis